MAALPDLITVEQFRHLPESGEFAYELHYGEVVAMTRPRAAHWALQWRLTDLLKALLQPLDCIGAAACPQRQHCRFADFLVL